MCGLTGGGSERTGWTSHSNMCEHKASALLKLCGMECPLWVDQSLVHGSPTCENGTCRRNALRSMER
eukprot:5430076-Alexandrium_andersonii.AAC.1